jgi:hypothetical protein
MFGAHFELWDDVRVSEVLCCTPGTLARWRSVGIGPTYIRLGPRKVRYRPADVKDFIKQQRRITARLGKRLRAAQQQ